LAFCATEDGSILEAWPLAIHQRDHNLVNDIDDPILRFTDFEAPIAVRWVKIVYPQNLSHQPIHYALELSVCRGCHMGIFPSYYRSLGIYTP
jgi:hypothetical protein